MSDTSLARPRVGNRTDDDYRTRASRPPTVRPRRLLGFERLEERLCFDISPVYFDVSVEALAEVAGLDSDVEIDRLTHRAMEEPFPASYRLDASSLASAAGASASAESSAFIEVDRFSSIGHATAQGLGGMARAQLFGNVFVAAEIGSTYQIHLTESGVCDGGFGSIPPSMQGTVPRSGFGQPGPELTPTQWILLELPTDDTPPKLAFWVDQFGAGTGFVGGGDEGVSVPYLCSLSATGEHVPPQPGDIVAVSAKRSEICPDGACFSFTYRIDENPVAPFRLGIYASSDTEFDPQKDLRLTTFDSPNRGPFGVMSNWVTAPEFRTVGEHTVEVQLPGPIDSLLPPDKPFPLIVADDRGSISELDEDNNFVLGLVPLVVNVITHGWNSSADAWSPFAETLKQIPVPGSNLDGRIATHVSDWRSDGINSARGPGWFDNAALFLALSKVFPAFSPFLLPAAAFSARRSAPYAARAAFEIAKQVQQRYLLPAVESNALQRIHLIGHSRGAAVNAGVSQWLLDFLKYTNVVQYTALDGFATDFGGGAGIIGDRSILDAIAARKVNYRVEEGLEFLAPIVPLLAPSITLPGWAASALAPWIGDLRAPARHGFENTYITVPKAGGTLADRNPTNHVNITERYFASADAYNRTTGLSNSSNYNPNRQFILDNFAGWNRFTGSELQDAALKPGDFIRNDASSSFDAGEGEPNWVHQNYLHIPDGTFDSTGEIARELAAIDLTPTGDQFTDFWLARFGEPGFALSTLWSATGNVRLVLEEDASLAEVHGAGSSIGTPANLTPQARALEFDMQVLAATGGDRLEVSFNGTQIGYVDLVPTEMLTRYSLQLDGVFDDVGELTFRIAGAMESPAAIRLDNIALVHLNPWQNQTNRLDVNDDGFVTPLDVLLLINELNSPRISSARQFGRLPIPPLPSHPSSLFLDVSGDGYVVPLDVLLVINHLNAVARSQGEGEEIELNPANPSSLSGTDHGSPERSLLVAVAAASSPRRTHGSTGSPEPRIKDIEQSVSTGRGRALSAVLSLQAIQRSQLPKEDVVQKPSSAFRDGTTSAEWEESAVDEALHAILGETAKRSWRRGQ